MLSPSVSSIIRSEGVIWTPRSKDVDTVESGVPKSVRYDFSTKKDKNKPYTWTTWVNFVNIIGYGYNPFVRVVNTCPLHRACNTYIVEHIYV